MSDIPFCASPDPGSELRVAVVTCAVLEMEVRHYAAGLPMLTHVRVMEQGLHNEPDRLRNELQQAVEEVEQTTDANVVVLGYGLCSRGVEGVTTRKARMVLPRAHDCITVLLGSKERYAQYVRQNPGTYWYSPGWNLHHTPPGKERYDKLYKQYLDKFGADDAQFLMEAEQHWFTAYNRATYVDLTVGATEQDIQYTRDCANWLKWDFDHQKGDPQLLIDLLSGKWDDGRFVVLQPGQTIRMTADEGVMEVVDASVPVRSAR